MIELIATIILIGSLTGIGVILYCKLPELRKLPTPKKDKPFKESFKNFWLKIKSSRFFKTDFFENILQKLLSKIKILAIKIENKCSRLLQGMREKSVKKEEAKNDKYWQRLKKSLKKKKK